MRDIHPFFDETFLYYDSVPVLIREALWYYLAYGIMPGGFLSAALHNDFMAAMCQADASWNGRSFRELAKWMIQYMPPSSYGRSEDIKYWTNLTDWDRLNIMIEYRLRPGEFDILSGKAVS